MLKPSYIEQLPKRLIELYSEVEIGIIAHMAERIKAQNMVIPSVQWQYQKLIEMGNFHSYIVEALASQLGTTRLEVERLMLEAGQKAITLDTTIYRKAGLSPPTISQSYGMQQVIRSGYDNTMGLFENLTNTTANTATNQFEQALDKTWLNVNSGAFSHTEATKIAIDDLASKGLKAIEYPSGHTDYLDVAVRRATVTGVNQTAAKVQEELADELDSDLVETTAHSGARPDHAKWQGKVFSRSGASRKYPPFRESTGYGTGAGLCGWNCRHSFFPFFEGSEPVYTQAELDELNAKNIEYNGKMYTEYETTQIQRKFERDLRANKRRFAAQKAAGLDTSESAAAIAQLNTKQKTFLEQTGLKRQYDRENVEGWGKKEAAKARGQAKIYESNKNLLTNSSGKRIIKVKQSEASLTGEPNSITQTENRKGGINRNYYDEKGIQFKQISNNHHNHKPVMGFGKQGEHAHDYTYDDDGNLKNRPYRELNEDERKENEDIL